MRERAGIRAKMGLLVYIVEHNVAVPNVQQDGHSKVFCLLCDRTSMSPFFCLLSSSLPLPMLVRMDTCAIFGLVFRHLRPSYIQTLD